MATRRRTVVLLVLPLAVLWSCAIVRGKVAARDISTTRAAPHRFLYTRVKAHLTDGSTVVYLRGVEIADPWLLGVGTRYDLALRGSPVDSLPLDSVVAMESFHETVRPVETVLLSGGAVLLVFILLLSQAAGN